MRCSPHPLAAARCENQVGTAVQTNRWRFFSRCTKSVAAPASNTHFQIAMLCGNLRDLRALRVSNMALQPQHTDPRSRWSLNQVSICVISVICGQYAMLRWLSESICVICGCSGGCADVNQLLTTRRKASSARYDDLTNGPANTSRPLLLPISSSSANSSGVQ